MKYVIIMRHGLELPVIFPEVIDHDTFRNMNPIAAGEIELYGEDKPLPNSCSCDNAIRVRVFGKSTTLNLKSRPEDQDLITREILRHYH